MKLKKLLPKIRTLIISVDNCFLEVTTELLNEALKHASIFSALEILKYHFKFVPAKTE